jgi:ATP-dependent Clp protease ATP-binding subunit ClpA
VCRTAFDEAIALGHHWVGEEHFLLALVGDHPPRTGGASLLAPLGLSHAEVASAVTARIDMVGPPLPKEFEGCLSAPTYHTILGRAEGFALGSGSALTGPADVLAALFWEPAGTPSELLATVGRSRSTVLDIVTGSGRRVPVTPTANPLAAPAEREAVVLGHSFIGDEHVVLAMLADEPDDRAGQALRQAGVGHDRLATRLAHMVANCDPPVPPSRDVGSARPNPRCRQLMGRAEGLATMLGDGVVVSTDGLIAYLWQGDGQPVLALEALDTSATDVLAALAELDVAVPTSPLPQPDRTPWGERVYVPAERMKDVVARLSADLPPGTWGCNSHEGREWVVAHAVIDLAGIVDDVLAS